MTENAAITAPPDVKLGPVTDVGGVDIAPALKDGRPHVAIWAVGNEPAILDARYIPALLSALVTAANDTADLAQDHRPA